MQKLNTNIFIEKAKNIHGNKYDYSLVEYTSSRKKVIIICSNSPCFGQIIITFFLEDVYSTKE
jgi:hypothetical protein